MHSQKTVQHCQKEQTRKKKSTVEDAGKINEKIKKNEPSEQLKSTESLKRERPKNNHPKRTKYMKTALRIVKNGDSEDGKAKEEAGAEKANK